MGAGKGVTILQGAVGFDYTFYNTTPISNFVLQDLTIDVQNGNHASAVQLYSATNCVLNRVEFKNVASGGWMLKIGVSNSATAGVDSLDNKVIDCDFDTHDGTLEMFVLFNVKNTQIIRPKFRNKLNAGPVFGLWQKCYGTKLISPDFKDCNGKCIYYSVTVEDTYIENPYFENCREAIYGSNVSDNGTFGLTAARNLKVVNPVLKGGANSIACAGIQLGAIDGVEIINPTIEKYEEGMTINSGNMGLTAPATNWSIVNPYIRNCNPLNTTYGYHAGILFGGTGGSIYGKIIGGNIFDDQNTKTQKIPISFGGSGSFDHISITNTRLVADIGFTPLNMADTAVLGGNVTVQNSVGVNPDVIYAQGNVSGTTIFNRVNGRIITATLTGNITVTLTADKVNGDELILKLAQDATGSRTATWPSNFKKAGGTLVLSPGTNAVDVIKMRWDGTNWNEVSRALNLS